MGIELGPFSHEMIPSPEKIPGCSHFGGVGIGHGDHASPEEYRDFVGVDLVIFGLAAVDGFHVQGMTEDKRDTMLLTQIGNPVPGEHAFYGDDNILPEGFYDAEKDISSSCNVSVQSDLPCFIEDAEIHFFGVKVDSAIKFVLFGVKSHGLPPLLWLMFCGETDSTIILGEALNSINRINSDWQFRRVRFKKIFIYGIRK
jgi:hypothetical protein